MQTLELTTEEVQKFTICKPHLDNFMVLVAEGIFDIRDGHAELHFDQHGVLRKVRRVYDRHIKFTVGMI